MESDAAMLGASYYQYGEYYHRSRSDAAGRLANEYIDMPAVLSLFSQNLNELSVLDAGCGSGTYARTLASRSASVVGSTLSCKMIVIAEREGRGGEGVTYYVGNIAKLPFKGAHFDIVLCGYVVENVRDIQTVFSAVCQSTTGERACHYLDFPPRVRPARRKVIDEAKTWFLCDYFSRGGQQSISVQDGRS